MRKPGAARRAAVVVGSPTAVAYVDYAEAEILAELDTDTRDYLQLLINGVGKGLKGRGKDLQEVLYRNQATLAGHGILYSGFDAAGQRQDMLRAKEVGFDRPYSSAGLPSHFDDCLYLIQWLEAAGYDVSYASSSDLHTGRVGIHQAERRVRRALPRVLPRLRRPQRPRRAWRRRAGSGRRRT